MGEKTWWIGGAVVVAVFVGWWALRGNAPEPQPAPDVDRAPMAEVRPAAAAERPPAAQPEAPVEEVAERLDLVLLNTTTGSDPERYRAHIEDRDREERFVVRTGDVLPGHDDATVVEIAAQQVTIDRDGRQIVIHLDRTARLSDSLKSPTIEDITANLQTGDLESVGEGLKGLWALRVGARDEDALVSQAAFAPKRDQSGRTIGLFASRIVPGSFFDQLGLKQGDVLLEVNGVRLDSRYRAAEVLPILEQETAIQLVVQGPEGEITLDSTTVLPN